MNDQKLKSQMTSGMIWKFAERFAAQGVSFVVSMVLARILMPDERVIIRTKLEKPSKIKGLALI